MSMIVMESKSRLLPLLTFYYFMCVGVLPVCMSVYHTPKVVRGGCQLPRNWSCRQL